MNQAVEQPKRPMVAYFFTCLSASAGLIPPVGAQQPNSLCYLGVNWTAQIPTAVPIIKGIQVAP